MTTTNERLTPKQYLKLHPEKYVMVTYEFGKPFYITPLSAGKICTTGDKGMAEQWSAIDNNPNKLDYYRTATGLKGLIFEQI